MDNYISFGKGKKSLVVIPGLAMRNSIETPKLLERVFKVFTKEWKVFVIDRPDLIPDGTTNRELGHAYADIMERLGTGPSDVIGVSQGGMIAQYLAIDHPELVSRLVLVSTLSKMNTTATAVFDGWLNMAMADRWDELNYDILSKLYTSSWMEKNRLAIDKYVRICRPDDKERYLKLIRACATGGAYEGLERIKCPIMVFGSNDDKVLTGAASIEIAEKTGCKIRMISGLGHAMYDEMPNFYDMVFEILSKFEEKKCSQV